MLAPTQLGSSLKDLTIWAGIGIDFAKGQFHLQDPTESASVHLHNFSQATYLITELHCNRFFTPPPWKKRAKGAEQLLQLEE